MSPLTPKLVMAAFLGLMDGLVNYLVLMDLPDAGRWSLISGLAVFALALLFLLVRDDRMARRYERAEKSLPCEPQFRVGANLREERSIASVNVYLCSGEMVLINVNRKEPVMTRIRREEVRESRTEAHVQLDLLLRDGRRLRLITPYMEELAEQLRRHGWSISCEET